MDVAGAVDGLGGLVAPDKAAQQGQSAKAKGTYGRPADRFPGGSKIDPAVDPKHPAQEGTDRRFTATLPVIPQPLPRALRATKNPRETRGKPGIAGVKAREAPVGVEPTMADLQSAALATWLRRLETHSSRRSIVKYAGCISQAEQAETTDSTRRPIFSAFDAPLFNESRSPHSFPNCCEQWRPAIPGDTFLSSCFPFRFRSRPASHSP